MPIIRPDDGQFGLDCYITEPDNDEILPDGQEFSDDRKALEMRAAKLIAAGRFKYLELWRWNADAADWDLLETFQPD